MRALIYGLVLSLLFVLNVSAKDIQGGASLFTKYELTKAEWLLVVLQDYANTCNHSYSEVGGLLGGSPVQIKLHVANKPYVEINVSGKAGGYNPEDEIVKGVKNILDSYEWAKIIEIKYNFLKVHE